MDRSNRRGYLEGGDGATRVGSITQPNIFGQEKDVNYEKYENPKVFGSYQVFLLALDFIFNLAVDCAYKEPLVILVCFLLQSLVLIINLILYIMSSANQAMQTGLKQRTVRHHEANIVTCTTYMILTAWWYIWALRRSWPSVSDQFSFSFSGPDTNTPDDSMPKPGSNLTQNQHHNATLAKGGSDEQSIKETGFPQLSVTDSEIFTLWSPGFLALYSIQRTVAVIHYIVYLKSTFIVLNSPFLDKYEEHNSSLSTRETTSSYVNPSFQNDKDGKVINDENAISSDSIDDSEDDELENTKGKIGSRNEGGKKGSSKPSIAKKTNPKAKTEPTSYSAGVRRPKSERNSPRSQRDGADAHSPNATNMPNKKTHKNTSSNKSKRLTKKNRSQSEDFDEEMSEDTMRY